MSKKMYKIWRNRNACDVLKEMRAMNETRNYSGLASAIEELQVIYQRMEDALSFQKDRREIEEARQAANKLVVEYNKEVKKKKPDMVKVKKILDDLKGV